MILPLASVRPLKINSSFSVYISIKVLGNGSLEKKLTVKAQKFSASAAEAIDAKGGAHEVI